MSIRKGAKLKYLVIIILNILFLSCARAEVEGVLSLIDTHEELKSFDNTCPVKIYRNSAQEYKDYISACSTEMKVCFNKCLEGSSNHCYGLANNLQSDTIDSKYAERLFSKACQQGLVTACTNRAAGIMRFSSERKECYAETFKLTCSKSDAWGCTMYGLILSRGVGLAKDTNLALKVLKTGCKNGSEDKACQYAKAIEKEILGENKIKKSHN